MKKRKPLADIEGDIKTIVSKIARVNRSELKDDIKLRDDLGIDSLNAMEILAAIEVKYKITIDEAKAFDVIGCF